MPATTRDEKINFYGQTLAQWADIYHVTVQINGMPTNGARPTPAGYSAVYWNDGERVPFKENLRKALQESNCTTEQLETFFSKIDSLLQEFERLSRLPGTPANKFPRPEQVEKELQCLGKVKFKPVHWSSD